MQLVEPIASTFWFEIWNDLEISHKFHGSWWLLYFMWTSPWCCFGARNVVQVLDFFIPGEELGNSTEGSQAWVPNCPQVTWHLLRRSTWSWSFATLTSRSYAGKVRGWWMAGSNVFRDLALLWEEWSSWQVEVKTDVLLYGATVAESRCKEWQDKTISKVQEFHRCEWEYRMPWSSSDMMWHVVFWCVAFWILLAR